MPPVLRPRIRAFIAPEEVASAASIRHAYHKWSMGLSRPTRGIPNHNGEVCYLNSVMQALMHIPKLLNWLHMIHTAHICPITPQESCLACCLRNVAEAYYLSQGTNAQVVANIEVALTEMIPALAESANWDMMGQETGEQDSPEFLLQFLDGLRNQGFSLEINGFFQLQLQKTLTCANRRCKRVTIAQPSRYLIWDLAVNQPEDQKYTLKQCINENMKGVTPGWRCSHCNEISDALEKYKIDCLPEVLCIQYKLFELDLEEQAFRKRFDEVDIRSKFLNLSNHALHQQHKPINYELNAIVRHQSRSGNSAYSTTVGAGHYISHLRDAKRGRVKWRQANDSTITTVTRDEATESGGSFTPYLLFYLRN
ncbi:MAG: hypothetical protein M1825_001867 [Sarcosagium campestre]|nr:MAG: hypothetical protein M1825_001867 [Sarcosagium campestre]